MVELIMLKKIHPSLRDSVYSRMGILIWIAVLGAAAFGYFRQPWLLIIPGISLFYSAWVIRFYELLSNIPNTVEPKEVRAKLKTVDASYSIKIPGMILNINQQHYPDGFAELLDSGATMVKVYDKGVTFPVVIQFPEGGLMWVQPLDVKRAA